MLPSVAMGIVSTLLGPTAAAVTRATGWMLMSVKTEMNAVKIPTFVEMLGSASTLWAGMSAFVSQAMDSQDQHALILMNALLATPVYMALVII